VAWPLGTAAQFQLAVHLLPPEAAHAVVKVALAASKVAFAVVKVALAVVKDTLALVKVAHVELVLADMVSAEEQGESRALAEVVGVAGAQRSTILMVEDISVQDVWRLALETGQTQMVMAMA